MGGVRARGRRPGYTAQNDQRTIRDAATLAASLYRVGDLPAAERLYRDVVTRLSSVDGPGSPRALAARADLATVLHATGQCRAARAELAGALAAQQAGYGVGEPAGIRMLARLAAMSRDCGDEAAAERHFARAAALAAAYLPADHPVAAQVAALSAAPPSGAHPCQAARADTATSPGQTGPGGAASAPAAGHLSAGAAPPAPGGPADESDWWPPDQDDATADQTGDAPDVPPNPPDTGPDTTTAEPAAGPVVGPARAPRRPPRRSGLRSGRCAPAASSDAPGQVPGSWAFTPPAARTPQERPGRRRLDRGAQGAQRLERRGKTSAGKPRGRATNVPSRGGRPPTTAPGPPRLGLATRHIRSGASARITAPYQMGGCPVDTWPRRVAYPPEVSCSRPSRLPGDRPAWPHPGVDPATGPRTSAPTPPPVGAALARVAPPEPPEPPRSRWAGIAFGSGLAVLGVAGGWFAATTLMDQADSPDEPARAPAVVNDTPGASPQLIGAPPRAVKLRDGWDSITLSWTYPNGAEGPVLIAGGRTGEQQKAFQTLAPGSSSYTLHGLAERADYCFTVAVVYSTDSVVRSSPVCTDRADSPSTPPG